MKAVILSSISLLALLALSHEAQARKKKPTCAQIVAKNIINPVLSRSVSRPGTLKTPRGRPIQSAVSPENRWMLSQDEALMIDFGGVYVVDKNGKPLVDKNNQEVRNTFGNTTLHGTEDRVVYIQALESIQPTLDAIKDGHERANVENKKKKRPLETYSPILNGYVPGSFNETILVRRLPENIESVSIAISSPLIYRFSLISEYRISAVRSQQAPFPKSILL